MTQSLSCTLMRGGSSKAVILSESELPPPGPARDGIILKVFGSPDRRQIDGLGGADPLTSKLAIVGPPTVPEADIDYTFAQVGIEVGYVDYTGNCGNVLAAVAAYAVNAGYVAARGAAVNVRVHLTNTGRCVEARVACADGRAAEAGEATVAGVPGTGAPILLDFGATVGSSTGSLLPTGRPVDRVTVPGVGEVELSIVDAGNPMAFIALEALGLAATDGPAEIDPRSDLIDRVEAIRTHVATMCGIVMADGSVSENIPLLAAVGSPAAYKAYGSGALVSADEVDFISREFFCRSLHKAYGVAETVCTAAAACTPGTLVHRLRGAAADAETVRFGHPSGVIRAEVRLGAKAPFIGVVRTARLIMDGKVYV
ncbi:PrpF domain-containing protein [Acuticoccus mangrovi]|uniref:Methylitaconate delta2-delta3-isomerase n=1 Tax=Acuticoccus mangrovi TaxID=2796142 RepID=A0A934MHM9_9HYPH|nr:PrpF domain-containing protein [Acuticoccus mangrovi]MBJ3777100.1 methylitaconate delta2-delta3-isomerase [Acuticoccus mangrovi]